MTFAQHLDELRTRLLRSIVALLGAVTLSMIFYRELIEIASIPHLRAMSWLGKSGGFILIDPTHAIGAIMKLSCIVGFFVASPYVARELWGFVAAGLYREEKRYVRAFAPISYLLFVLGCVFGYFLLIPYALYAMVGMMPLEQVQPIVSIGNYLGLVMTLTILLGTLFQLPLLMVLLSKLGLVAPPRWRAWRRAAILGNIVLAALLAPPDPQSMLVFALPLLALYEIGVWSSALAARESL
jgi:Tat protein translocase TatC